VARFIHAVYTDATAVNCEIIALYIALNVFTFEYRRARQHSCCKGTVDSSNSILFLYQSSSLTARIWKREVPLSDRPLDSPFNQFWIDCTAAEGPVPSLNSLLFWRFVICLLRYPLLTDTLNQSTSTAGAFGVHFVYLFSPTKLTQDFHDIACAISTSHRLYLFQLLSSL
jgi:hypothetical protein